MSFFSQNQHETLKYIILTVGSHFAAHTLGAMKNTIKTVTILLAVDIDNF